MTIDDSTENPSGTNQSNPLDEYGGTIIDGRYRIMKTVDAGGMATVYRAYDERLDRDVAIKIMHSHLANNPKIRQRFETEARAAARLQHPGIVQIFDQGLWNGRAYVVMEFINGPNLRQVLTNQGPLALGTALHYAQDILQALGVAHSHQIIHRDIKPENVLLTPDGTVKVADFGLAHAITQATGNTTGTVMGTVAYLAPEVITQEITDARSDIYAVGALTYELIAGTPPHIGKTSIGTAWAHVNQDIPPLSTVVEWIPESIDDFISTMCNRDLTLRPASTEEANKKLTHLISSLDNSLLSRRYYPPKPDASDPYEQVTRSFNTPAFARNGTTVMPAMKPDNTLAKKQTSSVPQAAPDFYPVGSETSREVSVANQPPVEKHQRKRAIIALCSVIVLLACSIGWWFTYGPGAEAKIPDLKGKTVAEAQRILRNLTLTPVMKEDFSDDVPAGKVARTNPKVGSYAYYNSKVEVYVSKGVEMVMVPDFNRMSLEEAKATAKKAHLTIGEISKDYSDDVDKNLISGQSVKAGKTVKHHLRIDLVISKGKEPVTVPDLKGKKIDEIKSILEGLKLIPDITESYSDDVPRGELIKQNTEPGKTLYHGDKISLEVSKGPETVRLPLLLGSHINTAKAKLRLLGLNVSTVVSPSDYLKGVVISQSPSAGTQVKRGSTVTLKYLG